MLLLFCVGAGGCGLANGFGGPDAPALKRADADGEGGGSTTEECESARRLGCEPVASVDSRGLLVESFVPSPPSEGSSGIWTFRRGRLAPSCALLVREGGVKVSETEDIDVWRLGWG
jgi:hypothetical protein